MDSKAPVKTIDQSPNQRQEWIVAIYCDAHFNVRNLFAFICVSARKKVQYMGVYVK